MGQLVEVKVYMSPSLYAALQNEAALCGCTLTAIGRSAVAREIVRRVNERKRAAKDLPLPGQKSIDGIAD